MRTLEQTYLEHDMGLLQMISSTVGLDLAAGNNRAAALELAASLQQSEQLRITCAGLSTQAREVLHAILSSGGRMTVAAAARRFGKVRPLAVRSDSVVLAFPTGNHADRFMAARLGEWEPTHRAGVYRYRLSAESLQHASEAGVSAE